MYLEPRKKRRRRGRSSPIRVVILLILISVGLYIITQQPDLVRPFKPTPVPTRTAQSYLVEGQAFFREGKLNEAIEAYKRATRPRERGREHGPTSCRD